MSEITTFFLVQGIFFLISLVCFLQSLYLCTHKAVEKSRYFYFVKLKTFAMDFKELLFTALAVAIGYVLGTIILSKLPANWGGGGSWEESV
jgi:hypothetical protein